MTVQVLDASVVASYLAPDEATRADHLSVLEGSSIFVAPWLIWAEFRNLILMKVRRGVIPGEEVAPTVAAFDTMAIGLDAMPSGAETMRLAVAHRLTVYDALYLELALRRDAPLLTLDRALLRAAEAEGVAPGG